MSVTVYADEKNKKTILTLLEEMGYTLPCNCQGSHLCNGRRYSFDCAMIPKEPITVSLSKDSQKLHSVSLEQMTPVPGRGDTLLADLGTTSIALALIHRHTGELRQTIVFPNPQKKYGADVVSRIQSSIQGSRDILQKELIDSLTEYASALCQRNHQAVSEISHCFIAGNTTMIHLLLNYDCTPLSGSPFAIKEPQPEPFFYHQCRVQILPWISAFVGGDITAGLYSCSMISSEETSLLIDLGTNGEMVLSHDGNLYAAATAAGPAFEGNGLSCGCPAIPGAVSRVALKRLRPALTTIENKLPLGICGSGAISLAAEMLRHDYMTRDGLLTDKFPADGIFLGSTPDGSPLSFTAEDLRNVQLSIAAVAAGIDTLTQAAAVSPDEVSHIYLGGGFGFYLNLDDCQTLGMFSSLIQERIEPMGNTCLKGLYQLAVSPDQSIPAPQVHAVNLAESQYFQSRFISHMTYERNPG